MGTLGERSGINPHPTLSQGERETRLVAVVPKLIGVETTVSEKCSKVKSLEK